MDDSNRPAPQDSSRPDEPATQPGETDAQVTRRAFLGRTTVTGAAAALALGSLLQRNAAAAVPSPAEPAGAPAADGVGTYAPLTQKQLRRRRREVYDMRRDRARHWLVQPLELPLANDDELLYPAGWANATKCLPHDGIGHPDRAAFEALVAACRSGLSADFAVIPLGGTQPLRNPQGGLCMELAGLDSHQTIAPPAPAFASAWRAAEMVEVYWAALLRDVPFAEYATDPGVAAACADLSALSDYRGPKQGGLVTPATIFRGPYAGCEVGPFVSQFLLKDIAFGAQINTQQVRVPLAGVDFLTGFADWLARQNGAPFGPRVYDPTPRYMRTARDLAGWVDADPPLQAGYHALAVLKAMGCQLDPGNPYFAAAMQNQDAFTTFGPVEWFDLVGRAPRPAHEAVWFQKWRVHRTLRPEEFAGRVHGHLQGWFNYPLHADVLGSQAVAEVLSRHGTALCPQGYPDGAPIHPAYPSGHSVGSGSHTTMLKAIFDESFVIPDPVEPTPDGLALVPYVGPPLTVGGELNKLAFNIGMARIMGGIHWRSDVVEGNALGERVSLAILEDMEGAASERFAGYSLTRFDGSVITT